MVPIGFRLLFHLIIEILHALTCISLIFNTPCYCITAINREQEFELSLLVQVHRLKYPHKSMHKGHQISQNQQFCDTNCEFWGSKHSIIQNHNPQLYPELKTCTFMSSTQFCVNSHYENSTTVLFFTMLCYTQTKHNITLENMSPTQCFIMGEMMRYSSKCYLPPPPILFSSFNLPPLPICLISQKQNSQEAWPHRRLTTTTAGLFLTAFTNTMLPLNHYSVQKSLATLNQVTGTW